MKILLYQLDYMNYLDYANCSMSYAVSNRMNLFKSKDMNPPDFIIDTVIQFICSPLFSDPVKEFIEERCVVFDGSEENKFSYTDLHEEFGKLIDSQLGSFMNETGINPNDFASALSLDRDTHQGVSKQALENAFIHIEAVDNFLQFKNIMVATNTDLNSRAMEELKRNGLLHSSGQYLNQFRNIDTPPPPYTEEYQEDSLRSKQLVGDEDIGTFVRELSTNLQKFEDTVREQQDATRHNIGVQLEDGTSAEQNKLYPSLNQSEEELIIQPLPTAIKHECSDTQHTSGEDLPISGFAGIDLNTEPTEHEPNRIREQFPKLEIIADWNSVIDKERDVSGFEEVRAQSPIEAADSLTSQWMEYAKEQQTTWKSSKDQTPFEQCKPSKEEMISREEHLKRQRDLLKRKLKRETQEQEQGASSSEYIPQVFEATPPSAQDIEKDKAISEDAKKFRRALSAKLQREVVNKHK